MEEEEGASSVGWAEGAGELVGVGERAGDGYAEGRIVVGTTLGGRGPAGRLNVALSLATTCPYAPVCPAKEVPDCPLLKSSVTLLHFGYVLEFPPRTCSAPAKSAVSSFPKSSWCPLLAGKTN